MRVLTSLFRPKYIGKYLNDSIFRIVVYFLAFVILISIPGIASISNAPRITYQSEVVLFQDMYNSNISTMKIENNGLTDTSNKVIYSGSQVDLCFNTNESDNLLVICFYEDYMNVLYNKQSFAKIKYENIKNINFDISEVQNLNFDEIAKVVDVINVGYDKVLDYVIPINSFFEFGSYLIEYLFSFLIFMWIGASINKDIPAKLRARVAVYSLTWSFVFGFIGANFGGMFVFAIGFVISLVCYFKALRNLVKVKKE